LEADHTKISSNRYQDGGVVFKKQMQLLDPALGLDETVSLKKQALTSKVRSPLGIYEEDGFTSKLRISEANTIGGATFMQLAPPDALPSLISKRVALFSKLPKLPPFVEKNEKFQEFFKRLCNNQ